MSWRHMPFGRRHPGDHPEVFRAGELHAILGRVLAMEPAMHAKASAWRKSMATPVLYIGGHSRTATPRQHCFYLDARPERELHDGRGA